MCVCVSGCGHRLKVAICAVSSEQAQEAEQDERRRSGLGMQRVHVSEQPGSVHVCRVRRQEGHGHQVSRACEARSLRRRRHGDRRAMSVCTRSLAGIMRPF